MLEIPMHVGIIPDGSRRFADRNMVGLAETYRVGAEIAIAVADAAREAGVRHLSFLATSSDITDSRGRDEMQAMAAGITKFFTTAADLYLMRLHIVGDASYGGDKLTWQKREFADYQSRLSASGAADPALFTLHVMLNYSGRIRDELTPLFTGIEALGIDAVRSKPEMHIASAGVPPIDLVIRTGGIRRLGGFFPFQCAYAALRFRNELWPEYTCEMFEEDLAWYDHQDHSLGT